MENAPIYPTLTSYIAFFRDAADDARLERLRFHLSSGDYFPFVATVVGLLEEAAQTCSDAATVELATALRKDLIHLHESYDLTPKASPIAYEKRHVVRFDS